MHNLAFYTYIILALIGILAGIVDTLAGGGGLITLPTLLGIGLPPAVALGTNRLQGCIGELTATIRFFRKGHINLKAMWLGLLCASLGGTLGTILVQYLHAGVLKKIIPFFMLGILIYSILTPQLKRLKIEYQFKPKVFYFVFGLLIGFYNGFFGPGTGSIWIVMIMLFLCIDLQKATMQAKPLNFIGNFVSLLWFIAGGNVAYSIGLTMAVGQVIGARIGAGLVMSKGIKLIRPVFIIVVTLMTVDLFMKGFLR